VLAIGVVAAPWGIEESYNKQDEIMSGHKGKSEVSGTQSPYFVIQQR